MAWFLLILVLLAAAFGVLGAVIKVTAFLVLTILLTLAVLAAVAWFAIRSQMRRWQHEVVGSSRTWDRPSNGPARDLPTHDDRY